MGEGSCFCNQRHGIRRELNQLSHPIASGVREINLLGKPRSLIKYVQDRPGHDRRYAIDCAKAERELGFRPRPYLLGLEDAIRWFRQAGYLDGKRKLSQ